MIDLDSRRQQKKLTYHFIHYKITLMINIKNLSKSFNQVTLFKELNLELDSDRKVLISGPSGCGKSTLLKLLCGFESADSGQIEIDGTVINKQNISRIRDVTGYIGQQAVFTDLTLKDAITEVSQFKQNRHIDFSEEKINRSLELFNLNREILSQPLSQFSGGEKQRAALLILSLLDKKVWLLDEISSGLDPENSRLIMESILKFDVTAIIVSHDPLWINSTEIEQLNWSQYVTS